MPRMCAVFRVSRVCVCVLCTVHDSEIYLCSFFRPSLLHFEFYLSFAWLDVGSHETWCHRRFNLFHDCDICFAVRAIRVHTHAHTPAQEDRHTRMWTKDIQMELFCCDWHYLLANVFYYYTSLLLHCYDIGYDCLLSALSNRTALHSRLRKMDFQMHWTISSLHRIRLQLQIDARGDQMRKLCFMR